MTTKEEFIAERQDYKTPIDTIQNEVLAQLGDRKLSQSFDSL
jgi:hypothetical protein